MAMVLLESFNPKRANVPDWFTRGDGPPIPYHIVAAVGTSFIVLASWLPIKLNDLFRSH